MGNVIEGGQVFANTSDGVIVSLTNIDLVSRLRIGMDHGGDTQPDRIRYMVWQLRFDGAKQAAYRLPVSFVWHRGLLGTGDPEELRFPTFVRSGDTYVPNGCLFTAIAAIGPERTECLPGSAAPLIMQLGQRAERVMVRDTKLTFADGLDGKGGSCTLDLERIAKGVATPLVAREGAANYYWGPGGTYDGNGNTAFRFAVSYLPPGYAYLIDYGQAQQPIYRVSCAGFELVGQVLPDATRLIAAGAEANTRQPRVVDMVADPGGKRPALLLELPDGDYGLRTVVLRSDGSAQEIPNICHDCPVAAGFFAGDPGWLLTSAGPDLRGGKVVLGVGLIEVATGKESSRELAFALPKDWSGR